MRNRVAFTRYGKNVLIILIIFLIDIILVFSSLFISYNRSLSGHKGSYGYDELFRINNDTYNLSRIYKVYKYFSVNNEDELSAYKLFEHASFNVVAQPDAEMVLLKYNGDHDLADLDLAYYFNFDCNENDDSRFSALLNTTGYLVYGSLFLYNDNLYLYADFIAEPIINDSEMSIIERLKTALAFCKTKKCLFKVDGLDSDFISENFYTEKRGDHRIFPSWYNEIKGYPAIEILLILLFFAQFPMAIKCSKKFIR